MFLNQCFQSIVLTSLPLFKPPLRVFNVNSPEYSPVLNLGAPSLFHGEILDLGKSVTHTAPFLTLVFAAVNGRLFRDFDSLRV